jgi:putative glutamine amidotransferase
VAGLPVPPHPRHEISITSDSLLARALRTTSIEVSSFHHQAIDRIGSGLEVVARSADDGLPEAVEMPGRPVLAVQWELQEEWRVDPRFASVFDWFVRTASDFGDGVAQGVGEGLTKLAPRTEDA